MNKARRFLAVGGVLFLVFITAFLLLDSLSVLLNTSWRETLQVLNPVFLQEKYRELVLGLVALCASGFVLWRISDRRAER